MSGGDPRVFFAAERTLLAWLRTSIAVIGMGFLVARFGLFLTLVQDPQPGGGALVSDAIGVALVLVGVVTIVLASLQHRRFVATLAEADLPPRHWASFAVWISLLVALCGSALAVYLALGVSH